MGYVSSLEGNSFGRSFSTLLLSHPFCWPSVRGRVFDGVQVLTGKYGFPPEVFQKVSKGAKELIGFPCLFGGESEFQSNLVVGSWLNFLSNQLFDGAVGNFKGENWRMDHPRIDGCKWLGWGSPPHGLWHEVCRPFGMGGWGSSKEGPKKFESLPSYPRWSDGSVGYNL